MLCHLLGALGFVAPMLGNLVGPFIVWLMKKDEMPFVDDQGKEALNFQITVSLVCLLVAITCVGVPLMPIPIIIGIVFAVLAALKARDGVSYRYPCSIKFLR
jgi:hypothetical protein